MIKLHCCLPFPPHSQDSPHIPSLSLPFQLPPWPGPKSRMSSPARSTTWEARLASYKRRSVSSIGVSFFHMSLALHTCDIQAGEAASCWKGRKHKLKEGKEIPKPKGMAGRCPPKGYNLQDAMGLEENKRWYNKFAVSD
jgi:hypothetical protein